MRLEDSEIERILDRIAATHPEYRVKNGELFYEKGRETYLFSSHHFISHYRVRNSGDYADLLDSYRHSRAGQDRTAHGQVASCLGRYAKHHHNVRPIGRRVSKDVHDNVVRPKWWVWSRR
jgi:hypothetical protein